MRFVDPAPPGFWPEGAEYLVSARTFADRTFMPSLRPAFRAALFHRRVRSCYCSTLVSCSFEYVVRNGRPLAFPFVRIRLLRVSGCVSISPRHFFAPIKIRPQPSTSPAHWLKAEFLSFRLHTGNRYQLADLIVKRMLRQLRTRSQLFFLDFTHKYRRCAHQE